MSAIEPTIITTADSEGNAAQIHVTGEAIVIHTAEGAAPTGIPLTGTLDGLDDVVITSPSSGQNLQYNGTNWVNSSTTATDDDARFLGLR